jgi:hypothetical protein
LNLRMPIPARSTDQRSIGRRRRNPMRLRYVTSSCDPEWQMR